MTKDNTYKWAKFKNGIGFVALVNLDVEQNSFDENIIVEHYSGQGFTSQGNIEAISVNGYEPWKIGARNGLKYAFSLINSYWTVHIHKIEGLASDTNSTVVGYTVLLAFLEKINFQLDAAQIKVFENFVFSSCTIPNNELIPDFFTMTFTKFGN